jgi:beta-lactam-binding protein with PASTA domain
MPSIKQRLLSAVSNKKFLYILLGMIAAFFLLNGLVLPWYVNHGDILHVPNVMGQPVDSAKKTLLAQGLIPMESDTRPDPQAPAGTVVGQNPDVDAVVKNGRRVYLTISGGEVLVIVPALRGRSVRDAKFTLERSGLRIGDVEYAASDAYPENTIVEQSIQPGMKVSKATAVKITISRGKELQQITVPDFTGKTLSEAERLIAQQGLKLGNITLQASFDLIPNTVVDQFPRGGESVMAGQAVDLFVVKAGKPKEEIQHPKN